MFRFLTSADLHLTNSNGKFRVGSNGVNDLLAAQEAFIDDICEDLKRDDTDGFIFAGDFTDAETLGPIVQTHVNRIIKKLAETGKFILLLEGNHCVTDKKNEYTVLGAASELSAYDNVHFVTQTEAVEWKSETGQKVWFHCFPYFSDYDKIAENIARRNQEVLEAPEEYEDARHIMVFHFPTKNALLDNGMPAPHGVDLPHDITCNFDVCIGGDFHRSQQVNENTFYVGAPFDLKFGEHHPRGYQALEMEADGRFELNQIPNLHQYNLVKTDVETFFDDGLPELVDADPGRTVLKLTGEASHEQMLELEGARHRYYSFSAPRNSYKGESQEVSVEVVEDSGVKDLDLIRAQMTGITKEVEDRAVEIFEEIAT